MQRASTDCWRHYGPSGHLQYDELNQREHDRGTVRFCLNAVNQPHFPTLWLPLIHFTSSTFQHYKKLHMYSIFNLIYMFYYLILYFCTPDIKFCYPHAHLELLFISSWFPDEILFWLAASDAHTVCVCFVVNDDEPAHHYKDPDVPVSLLSVTVTWSSSVFWIIIDIMKQIPCVCVSIGSINTLFFFL